MLVGAFRSAASLLRPNPAARPLGGMMARCLSTATEQTNPDLPFGGRKPEDISLEELEGPRPPRNSLVGVVVSTAMQKSIVVRVWRLRLLPRLMVRKKSFKKIMAHDENNECRLGDIVRIRPSRPLSKRKNYTLHEILKKDPKLTDPIE